MNDLLYMGIAAAFFISGALNFLPALALGPIVEHFLNLGRHLF